MIHCMICDCLVNNDPDGMVLTCTKTGQHVFIDDIPYGRMSKCPLDDNEIEIEVKCNGNNPD